MQLFYWLPSLAFLITFWIKRDLLLATTVLIIVATLSYSLIWIFKRKIEMVGWLNLGFIILFGALSLLTAETKFIQWRPTLLYFLFAFGIVVMRKLNKTFWRASFGQAMPLNEAGFIHFETMLSLFFVAIGFINLIVVYTLSEAQWVYFKLFGIPVLLILALLLEFLFLNTKSKQYQQQEANHDDSRSENAPNQTD